MVMAQAGLELPETKNRPAFQLPHLSHHNSDAHRRYTQKNTQARVVRFIFSGFQSWLQIFLQRDKDIPRVSQRQQEIAHFQGTKKPPWRRLE